MRAPGTVIWYRLFRVVSRAGRSPFTADHLSVWAPCVSVFSISPSTVSGSCCQQCDTRHGSALTHLLNNSVALDGCPMGLISPLPPK